MIKVIVLGGGNVAYHLTANLIKNEAVNLVQVYNRSISIINYLKGKTLITDNLDTLEDADIYIIAISDDAISEFSSKLILKDRLVVHTSGSVAMEQLNSISNKGVFYLLQTFSKESTIDFSTLPICIETKKDEDLKLLETLAKSITSNYFYINSEQRKSIHVAAVFVNNFVNHLYHLGNKICDKNNVPFEILLPLIKETASKITGIKPIEAQTGPAKRNNLKTISKHKVMLTKSQREIYTLLTKSIQETYGKKL